MSDRVSDFSFDDESDLPLWVQLRDRMAHLIDAGVFKPGEKLPTVRKFAADLHIAYNTVSKAYMALEREGYAVTVRGSGVYVKNFDDLPKTNVHVDSIVEDFVNSCLDEGLVYDEIPVLVSDYIRVKKRDYEEKKQRSQYDK